GAGPYGAVRVDITVPTSAVHVPTSVCEHTSSSVRFTAVSVTASASTAATAAAPSPGPAFGSGVPPGGDPSGHTHSSARRQNDTASPGKNWIRPDPGSSTAALAPPETVM